MSAVGLSAAEKAELRRQKILAKRNARMAYAGGDHSRPPSTAPAEPTQSRQPASEAAIRETYQQHQLPPRSRLSRGEEGLPLLNGALFRSAFMAVLAAAYAIATHLRIFTPWKISAVELFLSAELCILAPRAMTTTRRLLDPGSGIVNTSNSFMPMPALNYLSNLQEAYTVVKQFTSDFAMFMFSFICMWYFIAVR